MIMELKVVYDGCHTKEELIKYHGKDSVEWIKHISLLIEDYIKRFKTLPREGEHFTLEDSEIEVYEDYEPLMVDYTMYSKKCTTIYLKL